MDEEKRMGKNKMTNTFFENIKHLINFDDSVDVPDGSLRRAHAMFHPSHFGAQPDRSVFSLKRMVFADSMLRKAGISKKMLFEFNEDSFVQLTLKEGISGFVMDGFFNGFNPEQILLFSDLHSFPVDCEDGIFSISSLVPGIYDMMFEEGGKRFWIRNLEVESP